MKILLLNFLVTIATHSTEMGDVEDYTWVLDELNAETTEMTVSSTFESKVKIFDVSGNLVKEILKSDIEDNNLESAEYKIVAQSAFMFDYLGDSYFLLED